jgi:hypothetical protein
MTLQLNADTTPIQLLCNCGGNNASLVCQLPVVVACHGDSVQKEIGVSALGSGWR